MCAPSSGHGGRLEPVEERLEDSEERLGGERWSSGGGGPRGDQGRGEQQSQCHCQHGTIAALSSRYCTHPLTTPPHHHTHTLDHHSSPSHPSPLHRCPLPLRCAVRIATPSSAPVALPPSSSPRCGCRSLRVNDRYDGVTSPESPGSSFAAAAPPPPSSAALPTQPSQRLALRDCPSLPPPLSSPPASASAPCPRLLRSARAGCCYSASATVLAAAAAPATIPCAGCDCTIRSQHRSHACTSCSRHLECPEPQPRHRSLPLTFPPFPLPLLSSHARPSPEQPGAKFASADPPPRWRRAPAS